MEISNQLKRIRAKEQDVQSVIKDIESQQQELKNKLHIFQVIEIAGLVEDLLNNGVFEKYKVGELKILCGNDYDAGTQLDVFLSDKNGEELDRYENGVYIEPLMKLKEVFDNFSRFSSANISQEFWHQGETTINVEAGMENKIFDILLSNELKKVLNYNNLQIDLEENQQNSQKKMKL